MVWGDPSAISASGIDRDTLRILFDDLQEILECQPSTDDDLGFRLLSGMKP